MSFWLQIQDTFVHYIGPNWLLALACVIAGVVMMAAAYCTYGAISSILAVVGVLMIVSALAFSATVALFVGVPGGVTAAALTRRRRLQGKYP